MQRSEGTINVKAYLEQAGQANSSNSAVEIRRFDLDQDVSTSYEYLRSKISSIYPSLAQTGFHTYWKDDENDMVAISSDEELIQAMIYGRPDGLLRLYVKSVASDASTSEPFIHTGRPSSGFGAEHPGVVCDACDGSIRGLRFKCLVCTDYDLCSTCCEKGLHNHHYMLRLASPAPEWTGCGRRAGRDGGHGAGQAGWGWPGFGGLHGGWGAPAGNMRRFWRNLMRSQQPAGTAPGAEEPTAEPRLAPNTEHSHPDAEMTEAEREQHRDYLQHVGEQVSAMLEPLGVSVDVEVEEGGERRRAAGGNRQRGQGQGRCQGRGQGNGQCRGQGRKLGGKDRQFAKEGRCKAAGDGNNGDVCSRGGKCKRAEDCARDEACATRDQPHTSGNNGDVCSRGGKCKPAEDCTRDGACAERDQPHTSNTSASELQGRDEVTKPSQSGNDSQASSSAEAPPREDAEMDSGEDASWIKIESKGEDVDMITLEDVDSLPTSNSAPLHTIPALRLYPSLTSADVRAKEKPAAAPQPEPSAPAPDQSTSSGPSAPAQKSALDAKVAEAIEQMRAMGFHDDGGWMTSMLYENSGDVYKVIDSVLRAAQVSGSTRQE